MTPSTEPIELCFRDCRGIAAGENPREILDLLRSVGGTFRSYPDGRVIERPEDRAGPDGCITVGVLLEHPLLGQCQETLHHVDAGLVDPNAAGLAKLSYLSADRSLLLSQWLEDLPPEQQARVATGLVEFGRLAWQRLRPRYGFVDLSGFNASLSSGDPESIRYLHWANFFGSEIVERLGMPFLLAAPQGEAMPLGDGGLLYVGAPFLKWGTGERDRALQYFRSALPGIETYVPEPFEEF
jgi:hypothetical protein